MSAKWSQPSPEQAPPSPLFHHQLLCLHQQIAEVTNSPAADCAPSRPSYCLCSLNPITGANAANATLLTDIVNVVVQLLMSYKYDATVPLVMV